MDYEEEESEKNVFFDSTVKVLLVMIGLVLFTIILETAGLL